MTRGPEESPERPTREKPLVLEERFDNWRAVAYYVGALREVFVMGSQSWTPVEGWVPNRGLCSVNLTSKGYEKLCDFLNEEARRGR